MRTTRDLIGTRQAAEILGVTQGRIRQLILPGAGGARPVLWSEHVGMRAVVVDRREVEALAAEYEARRAAGGMPGPKPGGFKSDRPGKSPK